MLHDMDEYTTWTDDQWKDAIGDFAHCNVSGT